MMLVPTCVCGHPQGKNVGDCERCSLIFEIRKLRIRLALMHPTNQAMLVSYLRAVISQSHPDGYMPDFVPTRILAIRDIEPDIPQHKAKGYKLNEGEEYDCKTNRWGAISVPMKDGLSLGVKLHECEIVAMGPNNKKAFMEAQEAAKAGVISEDDAQ